MNDELNAVRRSRPAPVRGWAASSEGRAVLDAVLAQPRAEVASARRRRPVLLAGAGAVAAVALTAAAVGRLPFVPSPGNSQGGMCARTLSAQADLSQLPAGERFDPRDPAASCARHWDAMFGGDGTPRPQRFAACWWPDSDGRRDGGAVVFPADGYPDPAAACAAIGFRPIKPPTK